MARMYPAALPAGSPGSEQIVFEALSQLSDEWMVFSALPWQG